jgi:hypothetical protein
MWAQRPKHILLSICLTDVKDPLIKVEPSKLHFKENRTPAIFQMYLKLLNAVGEIRDCI